MFCVALPVDSCLDSRRMWSPATCHLQSPGWMSPLAVVLSLKLDGYLWCYLDLLHHWQFGSCVTPHKMSQCVQHCVSCSQLASWKSSIRMSWCRRRSMWSFGPGSVDSCSPADLSWGWGLWDKVTASGGRCIQRRKTTHKKSTLRAQKNSPVSNFHKRTLKP